jgi:hypothetical protein
MSVRQTPPKIGISPVILMFITYHFSGLFAYHPMTTTVTNPIARAAIEHPIVVADTLPFVRYSLMTLNDAPTTRALSVMKNVPFVNNLG